MGAIHQAYSRKLTIGIIYLVEKFFFILYNAPSGLLVYWTMSNFLSILQQVYTNRKTVAGFKKEIEEKDAIKAQKKAQKKKRNR